MVTVQIAAEERSLAEADPNWIVQQVQRRRDDGVAVCVQVRVKEPGLDVIIKTRGCPSFCGGGRLPNEKEQALFALWERLHMNEVDFSSGNLVAFIKQLGKFLNAT